MSEASELVEVFVEIPKGSRNKYEWDHETQRFVLDRMLFSAVQYPGDYGFIPRTWAEDDDPLDALVLLGEPTFPGCTIHGRVAGIFHMSDEKGPDAKVITVPEADPRWSFVTDLDDLPQHELDELSHFFAIYKQLEGVTVEVRGFEGRQAALAEIAESRRRWIEMEHRPPMP